MLMSLAPQSSLAFAKDMNKGFTYCDDFPGFACMMKEDLKSGLLVINIADFRLDTQPGLPDVSSEGCCPAVKWRKPRRAQPEPAPLAVMAIPGHKVYREKLTVVSPSPWTRTREHRGLWTFSPRST